MGQICNFWKITEMFSWLILITGSSQEHNNRTFIAINVIKHSLKSGFEIDYSIGSPYPNYTHANAIPGIGNAMTIRETNCNSIYIFPASLWKSVTVLSAIWISALFWSQPLVRPSVKRYFLNYFVLKNANCDLFRLYLVIHGFDKI